MALSMRMRQQGQKNRRKFRFVVTDSRCKRDGKYIDCVGHYDPHTEDGMVVDKEKVASWLEKGAQPSEKMRSVLKKKCPEVLVSKVAAKK